jgi:hypothetical protein
MPNNSAQFAPSAAMRDHSDQHIQAPMEREVTNDQKSAETLAAPFNDHFSSLDEAQWAFELLQTTLLKLGVSAAGAERDRRISLTLPRPGIVRLRLNFGNWAIITFSDRSVGQDRVQFVCRVGHVRNSSDGAFADEIDGQAFTLASCSVASMRDIKSVESREFADSLTIVARRFKDWKGARVRAAHNPRLLRMVFDSKLRDELLRAGLDAAAPERRFWWVNQGKTYEKAKSGGFIWAPKKDSSGSTPFHWENMSRLSPGDIVFNYADTQLRAISIVKSAAYDSDRGALPDDWGKDGWRSDLAYYELSSPV